MKLPPASTYASSTASEAFWSVVQPKVLPPRQRAATRSPVRPSLRISMVGLLWCRSWPYVPVPPVQAPVAGYDTARARVQPPAGGHALPGRVPRVAPSPFVLDGGLLLLPCPAPANRGSSGNRVGF